jgi:oxygen-dependent protoporphyrinogen oxidase
MIEVAIVGAGIAGLAAAYELSRRGVSFVVLEASSRAGGVIFSESADGFVIDGGPDSLLVQKPEGIRLCQEIGLGERLVPTNTPRIAYIQRGGRLHPLPAASVLGLPTRVGSAIATRLFTMRGKMRMAAEVFVPRRQDSGDESIASFITRRFGEEATTYLAEPLLAGIHAGDVNRLSVRALFPRLVEAERSHGSVLRAFRKPATARAPGTASGAFRSLPGGLSEMIDALVRTVGVEHVRLRTPVAAVTGRGLFQIRLRSGESIGARAVILATPAYVTSALLRERDEELSRLCCEIPYASAATVVLAFNRGAVGNGLRGSGFVVPKVEATGILAASWLSSKWPNRAPSDKVLLRTFVGGARDPEALERSDAELVSRSLSALGPLLNIGDVPLFSRVYRWEKANAQHEVGHLDRMASIELGLGRHPGVFLTGSGFRGVGIPDCIADARKTAAAAASFVRAADVDQRGSATH